MRDENESTLWDLATFIRFNITNVIIHFYFISRKSTIDSNEGFVNTMEIFQKILIHKLQEF